MATGISHKAGCSKPDPHRRIRGQAVLSRCPECGRAAWVGEVPPPDPVEVERREREKQAEARLDATAYLKGGNPW